jgi:hypothetical protein
MNGTSVRNEEDFGAMSKSLNELRDKLITEARYGKITPQEAEAQAKAAGLAPFETQPELAAFDLMAESRWPIVMAIAWIAWRDPHLVMEQGSEFRSLCTHWIFREWNEPVQNGQSFAKRAGWFLERWPAPTAVGLTFLDAALRSRGELPTSARLTPSQAEQELWRALSEERLTAEGFDRSGALIEIPAREWTHLKLFEERERDVVKYDALDRDEPYKKVRFRREDMVSQWPRYVTVDIASLDLGAIADLHLEPMSTKASHVPLSVALCWVITGGGVANVPIRDEEAWRSGVGRLMPTISEGRVEIIGRGDDQVSRPLHPIAFASIHVPSPSSLADIFAESAAYIGCHLFEGENEWKNGFNDQFFAADSSRPRWTHLQVRREHVLKLWPMPNAKSKSQVDCRRWLVALMRESPDSRPRPKLEFQKEAQTKFRPLSLRQFRRAWEGAIEESAAAGWSKAGRPKAKSNRCAK